MYLQNEWIERLLEDGMFQDIDEPAKWIINSSNSIEFFEAINLDHHFTEEEVEKLIEKYQDSKDEDGEPQVFFSNLIGPLS